MIKYFDKKYTPNQFAKELLIDGMELKKDFWVENIDFDNTEITEQEIAQVHEQIRKRLNGLLKYLGKNYYYPSPEETKAELEAVNKRNK